MVASRKQATHKHVRAQSGFIGPKGISGPVSGCLDSHGQYQCDLIHQQGGRYEVRIPLCSFMEAPVVVQLQDNHSSSTTDSRLSKCDC